jgi:predicted naringenin-chalcone synthase
MRKSVQRFGCGVDRIAQRYSCLEDFGHTDWSRMRIFDLPAHPSGKSAGARSDFYAQVVNETFEKFYLEEATPPPVIIHVTCTGYVSPSGAQRCVAKRDWGRSTEVFHAYHMGCYAALPSIRLALGQLCAGKPSVDIVHTELCSLHLDPALHDAEQLVVQTLFADGMIRYTLATELSPSERGFEVLSVREEVLPNTENEMTWSASENGMRMTLSRSIPEALSSVLEGFLGRLFEAAGMGLSVAESRESAVFAVHPGGPRIIDQVRTLLGLRAEQVEASNAILLERGNMSSATLPHIWQRILEGDRVAAGTLVPSLAFGPGLTISGALLRVVDS